ncbi:MAG: hypothetical protein ACRD0C_16205 [Acidimicrobiia bacterium]
MIFWSGYERDVRVGRARRIWVRRAKCRRCGVSHALIPAFCLLGRLDGVAVILGALARVAAGATVVVVAGAIDVPYTTVRDWRRRHLARSEVLAAGFAAMTVRWSGVAPVLSPGSEAASMEALGAAWEAARRCLEGRLPVMGRWWSLVTGGASLAATRDPPWIGGGDWGLMPPVPLRP